MSNQNERYSKEYVSALEDRLAAAERERDEALEALEAPIYVARTDSGRVLYEGDHEASAIAAARYHFHNTRPREHVSIDNSDWNTRKFGGVRRPKAATA